MYARVQFQSLSGFPMSCNPITGTVKGFFGWVSIPIGFSNELQLSGGPAGFGET